MVNFFEILAIKRKNQSLFFVLFGAPVWQFAPVFNRKRKKNEAVFVIFMSKALHLMSFPLVSFKVNSILMENATVVLPFNATLGIGTGAGVSAAKLFYKFNLI